MSRRTADASKAIRLAWEKEQQRVLEGEGTRDWTEKQQQDIIDRGKAYDEDGKAFEGQHMMFWQILSKGMDLKVRLKKERTQ